MEVAVDILPATPRASTQGPPLPTTTSARQILPQSRQRRRHQATPLEKVFGSVLDHAGSRVQQPGWSSPQAGWNIAPTSNQTPRVLGRLGKKAILYDNPPRLVVAGPKKSWTMHGVTSQTVVTVETAGDISVSSTRGRNMASKAAAGVITGGVGLLFVGNAKTRTTKVDSRELYLSIDCPPFLAVVFKLLPSQGHAARQFALLVNQVARQL